MSQDRALADDRDTCIIPPVSGLWNEADLVQQLRLPESRKMGRSRVISRWIAEGLAYIEKDKRRYFMEKDLLEFLGKFQRKENRNGG